MSTPNNLTQEAKNDFLDRNRDLLALTRNGATDIFRRISASLALNNEDQDNVMFYANPELLEQKGYAGQVAREDFKRSMYQAICKAFLRCQHNYVIEFVAKLTPEALTQLEDIEISGGEREPRAVVPPPPPALSAAEQLEAEIRSDWDNLSTVEIRRKCNNKRYKAEFTRLMDAGALRSLATTYTDNGMEFRK